MTRIKKALKSILANIEREIFKKPLPKNCAHPVCGAAATTRDSKGKRWCVVHDPKLKVGGTI